MSFIAPRTFYQRCLISIMFLVESNDFYFAFL